MYAPVIELQNLGMQSGKKYLLKDITWQVEKGQHWLVFGMNGCGKTTLLSIIAGFRKYTHGQLKVNGAKYTDKTVLEKRSHIGFVSSSFFDRYYKKEEALDIVLSGKYGTFGLVPCVSDQDVILAKTLLEELNLSTKISQPYDLMSRGEKQNVLIARAFMSNPDILLLDEPCTGLDILNRNHLLNTVRDIAANTNTTIVYVTHYTEEILDIFQHTLLLKNGRIFAKGKTKDIFQADLMTRFLGYPVQIQYQPNHVLLETNVSSKVYQIINEVNNV